MKNAVALLGLLLAVSAYSQSFTILGNGVTLTTDKSGFVYDFGHFTRIGEMNFTGGQFFVENEKLITIDTKGFLYRKDEKSSKKFKGKGLNYILLENGTLTTIDEGGFFYKFDKDSALRKAMNFGGNFFTVRPDDKKPHVDLYTVNSKGNYFKMSVPGLNAADITSFGGTYFMTKAGVVYTVTKDGFVYSKAEVKVAAIKKFGGNYFIDSSNTIFTVAEEGFLIIPTLPVNLKLAAVTKFGSNYLIDPDGRIFTVDSLGNVFEREMKDHDLRNARFFSL